MAGWNQPLPSVNALTATMKGENLLSEPLRLRWREIHERRINIKHSDSSGWREFYASLAELLENTIEMLDEQERRDRLGEDGARQEDIAEALQLFRDVMDPVINYALRHRLRAQTEQVRQELLKLVSDMPVAEVQEGGILRVEASPEWRETFRIHEQEVFRYWSEQFFQGLRERLVNEVKQKIGNSGLHERLLTMSGLSLPEPPRLTLSSFSAPVAKTQEIPGIGSLVVRSLSNIRGAMFTLVSLGSVITLVAGKAKDSSVTPVLGACGLLAGLFGAAVYIRRERERGRKEIPEALSKAYREDMTREVNRQTEKMIKCLEGGVNFWKENIETDRKVALARIRRQTPTPAGDSGRRANVLKQLRRAASELQTDREQA